jgi:hypothetical protein
MSVRETRSLILLSCSHAKRNGGRPFDPTHRRVTQFLGDDSVALIKRRAKLLKLLRGETGRLYNEDQKGGFRDLRECNQKLVQGPEFDGAIPEAQIYLPAYERYCGRFFGRLTSKSPAFWTKLQDKPVEIVFVSALYGLILWDELVQDYDCHLADLARNGKERPVWELWRKTLSSALASFVADAQRSKPIVAIYDLLSEEEYQRAFQWSDLERLNIEIYHRVFRQSHGPDILPDLADLVAQLRRFFPGDSETFEPGRWHDLANGTSQVRFERYALTELDHLKLLLTENRPALRRVPPQTLDDFCIAEALWNKIQAHRNMPLASVVISFATAVEGFLRSTIPELKDETLGGAVYMGRHRERSEVAPALAELEELNSLRKRAAHRASYEAGETRLNKTHAINAQRLSYEVIERLIGRL